jgi:uncharacterized membrane protein YbhN (UPF0104 family)
MQRFKAFRWLLLFLQCVAGVLLLWWIVTARGVDIKQITDRFTLASIGPFVLGLLCFLAAMWQMALRYRLFPALSLSIPYLLSITLVQNALLTFVPWRAGEVGYPFFLRVDHNIPVASSIAAILAIRLADTLIVVIVALAGASRFGLDLFRAGIVLAGIILLGILAVFFLPLWRKRAPAWIQALASTLQSLREPSRLVGFTLLSIGIFVATSLQSALILRAVALPIRLSDAALFSALTVLAALLPIHPPGGWGTIDSIQIWLLGQIGHSPEVSASAILAAHSVYTLLILSGGFGGWILRRIVHVEKAGTAS